MSFEEMNALLDEALEFYRKVDLFRNYGNLEETLIPCLVSGQYVMERNEFGKIACFITYWKTDKEGFEQIKAKQELEQKFKGNVIYGLDCASLLPKKETYKVLNRIRTKEPYNIFCFHNKGKFKVFRRS